MAIFYSILNVSEINSCIIYNENNSSKINRCAFLKKLSFKLIQEQLEKSAACSILPSNLRAKMCKFSDTRTNNAPHQKGKHGRYQNCQGKEKKTRYYCSICFKFLCLKHARFMCSECCQSSCDDTH